MFSFRGRSSDGAGRPGGNTGRTLLREASIKIDSKSFPVKDINEYGLVVEGYDGDLVPKQRVYFDLTIQVGEREDTYRVEATVVRTADKTLVCRFDDLRRDALRAIQMLVTSRAQRAVKPTP